MANHPGAGPEENPVELVTTTLFAHGYVLESTHRIPEGAALTYVQVDEFGCAIRYVVALVDQMLSTTGIRLMRKLATRKRAHLVIVGRAEASPDVPVLTFTEFLARFGGGIPSLLPLEPGYADRLITLGHNRLPDGLEGTASDLFEEYVAAGLQFILGTRVIRYGSNRRGEKVPDGLAIEGRNYILYDAKAAGCGFDLDAKAMRQFADYLSDFGARYRHILEPPYAFLVISSDFAETATTLQERSRELFAKTRTPLACMNCSTLVSAIKLFADAPHLRSAIDWRGVLSHPLITSTTIESAARRVQKDGLAWR